MWNRDGGSIEMPHRILQSLTREDQTLCEQMQQEWHDTVETAVYNKVQNAWDMVIRYNIAVAERRIAKVKEIADDMYRMATGLGSALEVLLDDTDRLERRLYLWNVYKDSENARNLCDQSQVLLDQALKLLSKPNCPEHLRGKYHCLVPKPETTTPIHTVQRKLRPKEAKRLAELAKALKRR